MIVAGVVIDRDGFTRHTDAVPDRVRGFDVRHVCGITHPSDFANTQPAHIRVDLDHSGAPVGHVVHLERDAGGIFAVADVDSSVDPIGLAFSAKIDRARGSDPWTITRIALSREPAMIGARPVQIVGDHFDETTVLRLRARGHLHLAELLARAHKHKRGAPFNLARKSRARREPAGVPCTGHRQARPTRWRGLAPAARSRHRHPLARAAARGGTRRFSIWRAPATANIAPTQDPLTPQVYRGQSCAARLRGATPPRHRTTACTREQSRGSTARSLLPSFFGLVGGA
jgi:hypothetical protein